MFDKERQTWYFFARYAYVAVKLHTAYRMSFGYRKLFHLVADIAIDKLNGYSFQLFMAREPSKPINICTLPMSTIIILSHSYFRAKCNAINYN